MSAHTPGPWVITEGDEWTDTIHTSTPEQGIWTVASVNKRRDEFGANKRLIAAAPELLDALRDAVKDLELSGYAWDHPFLGKMRAVVAKATGHAP